MSSASSQPQAGRPADSRSPIGIVAAFKAEAATVGAVPALLRVSGVGAEPAAAAARALIADGARHLLVWGTAAALAAELEPATVVIFEAVSDGNEPGIEADPQWVAWLRAQLGASGVRVVRGISTEHPLVDGAAKLALGRRSGCAALDMESLAVAGVAARNGCSFAAVRSIVDPAGFTLPPAALAAIAHGGEPRWTRAAASCLKNPAQVPELIRLSGWFSRALKALEGAARVLDAAGWHPSWAAASGQRYAG